MERRFDNWQDEPVCEDCKMYEERKCDGRDGVCREYTKVHSRSKVWERKLFICQLCNILLALSVLLHYVHHYVVGR